MLAVLTSGALVGVEAVPVTVEINTNQTGDFKLVVVGLPDTAVKESTDRVLSAINNTGGRISFTRTVINLAPGDLRKVGPLYDLPIALGLLASEGDQLDPARLDGWLIAGELSLTGATRPIPGGLALARLCKSLNLKGVLLPPESAAEAALVEGVRVHAVGSLGEAWLFLSGRKELPAVPPPPAADPAAPDDPFAQDFSEIKGQHSLRRAVEVAVAGGHNLLIIGPPGSGKSMISKRLPTIMPEPSLDEFLEILAVHSAAGISLPGGVTRRERPFRSPHHTISDVGLLGGGSIPGPGEISLAHNGVLFLDELPEFKRSALEVMRQPLEDGDVSISRSAGKITLPASFMLVAAMNPCPCGYLGDPRRECRCSPPQVQRYRSRLSGPLLDRIDIHIEAPAVSIEELRTAKPGETSAAVRGRVRSCREHQGRRFKGMAKVHCNARMSHALIQKHCAISADLGGLLQQAMEQLNLSARAFDRILKVARTIADLAGSEAIQSPHLMEAIQYRSLDRQVFY